MVRKWYTTFAVIGYIRGKKWWKWGARIVLFAACPALPTLRQAFYYGILPLGLPFLTQKGSENSLAVARQRAIGSSGDLFGSFFGLQKEHIKAESR